MSLRNDFGGSYERMYSQSKYTHSIKIYKIYKIYTMRYETTKTPQIRSVHKNGEHEEAGESAAPYLAEPSVKPSPPKILRVPFWTENPNVLFQKEYILEFFPTEDMTYSQKLNAISRVIILMGILIFVFTQNTYVFIIAIITLGAVAIVYHNQHRTQSSSAKKLRFSDTDTVHESYEEAPKESFVNKSDGLARYTLDNEKIGISANLFDKSTPSNPFSNVLLTDYENNPTKKPAPASYNAYNNNDILNQAKEFVKQANPEQPDIADKLFKDLGEELQFEQSMRPFYSNPATTIPNDQQAFADFCYGSMISCKEGNMFACSRKYQTMPSV
jgi:hypothetical protein